jgi:hypothetical protein
MGLPLIEAAQAQKHVTHNEALVVLDALAHLYLLDRDLAAPPVSPVDGDAYLVAFGASGEWAGQDGNIAYPIDGAWRFHAPFKGLSAIVEDEQALIHFDGAAWADLSALISLQNVPLLGVGTTADASNPFSAKLNNALLTAKYVAEGGDGDLRIKANKEAAADTLSYLFQTNWSGRAEFGLIGDDDFAIKVSPDGSAWTTALTIDKTTGEVNVPTAAPGTDTAQAASTAFVLANADPKGKLVGVNAQTGTSYTLALVDAGKLVTLSNAAAIALTVPTNASVAFPVGTIVDIAQIGAGSVTIAGDTGVTLNSRLGPDMGGQYAVATLVKTATDTWLLAGDLVA